MELNLYQQVDILFSILEELLSSPFNKQFDDKAKHVLSKHGLEVADGKIVKSQRRVSAESKDERIMTALIHFFSNPENTLFEYWEGISKKEVLAWIEKQGQKPTWTEEDETLLTNIIFMLKEGAGIHFIKDDITKAVDWLKSKIQKSK